MDSIVAFTQPSVLKISEASGDILKCKRNLRDLAHLVLTVKCLNRENSQRYKDTDKEYYIIYNC